MRQVILPTHPLNVCRPPMRTAPCRWFSATLCLLGLLHVRGDDRLLAREPAGEPRTERMIQTLVHELASRLEIPEAIVVSIVPRDALLVSVAPPRDDTAPFRLSVERAFLDSLTEDELVAAVAHELGHVWVFTHHPYLQTEALANQIAMRVVTRESLARVYEKVWRIGGTKGDLATFLGPQERTPMSSTNSTK